MQPAPSAHCFGDLPHDLVPQLPNPDATHHLHHLDPPPDSSLLLLLLTAHLSNALGSLLPAPSLVRKESSSPEMNQGFSQEL